MHAETLEAIRRRATTTYHESKQQVEQDRALLLAEVDRLRMALAGHLFDGESLPLREAVRTEMITLAMNSVDAVRTLDGLAADLAYHAKMEGYALDMRTENGWVEVRERLDQIIKKASIIYDATPASVS